jgi:hypothetical protein
MDNSADLLIQMLRGRLGGLPSPSQRMLFLDPETFRDYHPPLPEIKPPIPLPNIVEEKK